MKRTADDTTGDVPPAGPAFHPDSPRLTASNICFKQLFVPATTREATKTRLLAAAGELFAERGFHGTKVRDIAQRARVNVAAGNYHFGSKKDLYLEVLREKFGLIRTQIEAMGAGFADGTLERASRPTLLRLLRARLDVMVAMLLGEEPNLHAQLMMREMADPSEALPVIVREFIQPLVDEVAQIVARLRPDLSRRQVDLVVFSVNAQVQFYRFMRPMLLPMLGLRGYGPAFLRELADHVYAFSIGGLESVGRKARGGRS